MIRSGNSINEDILAAELVFGNYLKQARVERPASAGTDNSHATTF